MYSIFKYLKQIKTHDVPIPWWLSGKKKNRPVMQETRVRSLSGKRSPVEENGNPLQYSCLGNPMIKPGGLQKSTGS